MFRVEVRGSLDGLSRSAHRAARDLVPRQQSALQREVKRTELAIRRTVEAGSMAARRVPGARRRFPSRVGAGNHVRRPVLRGLESKVSAAGGNLRGEITWKPSKILVRVRPLFAYIVRQKHRLRHPVMGQRSTWVSQVMPDGWAPTRKLPREAADAAGKALDETAAILGGRRR